MYERTTNNTTRNETISNTNLHKKNNFKIGDKDNFSNIIQFNK